MFENRLLHWICWFYNYFLKIGNSLQSLFVLYMRITWGHQFFITGMGKLAHIEKVVAYFQSLNIPHPVPTAYSVGFFEMVCGFLLFFGFASRIAAIPLIVIMLVALSTAHAPEISEFRFLFNPSLLVLQEPYPFLITSLIVFIFGPGKISIDAWIKRWVERQPRY